MQNQSLASLRREKQRNSPETTLLRNKINDLLKTAPEIVAYAIKRDLACMTNMPFYKNRPQVIRFKMNYDDLICEYAEFFKTVSDKSFVTDLIKKLGINQSQILRKVAPRIGPKREVWEHAIPTKVIIDEMIRMINTNDFDDLRKLLDVYKSAGQRGLTKEQDKLLDKFRTSMPSRWNWRNPNVDPLARYKHVGIEIIDSTKF